MTKSRSTKNALISSILVLALCFSMLLGTTFAWFTDSAASAGNIIQSGTLDVTMEWKDATVTGAQQSYKDATTGAIFNYDKWEPGYVEAKNIKIGNAGTLALKYQINIVANGEVSELADVIDVYYAEGEYTLADSKMSELTRIGSLTEVLAGMPETANGDLLESETDIVTIALKMCEDAGNAYQGKSIGSDFSVQLFATQLSHEEDSFGDDYDSAAPYFLPAGIAAEDFGDNVAYFNGTYYATLTAALNAIHDSNATESELYLKPNADLGAITHAHVCSSITIYGNDAYVSGGERDFEIGIPQTVSCTIDSAIELNIYDLNGCAVWGTIPEGKDISISLNNCENVSKIMLPNYTTGNYDLSVSIDSCTFVGTDSYRDSAIWCRGLDNLTVSNTTFKNYAVGINQNNKDASVENYTLTNCKFIDCATDTYVTTQASYAAPVRAVASASGATVNLTLVGCEFIYTSSETAINGDVLTYQTGDAGTVNVVRS